MQGVVEDIGIPHYIELRDVGEKNPDYPETVLEAMNLEGNKRMAMREYLDELKKEFFAAMWNHRTWQHEKVLWRGVPITKFPQDILAYQEIIWKVKPHLIIETGTLDGGSALFFGDMLELYVGDDSEVVTIDINQKNFQEHPRVVYYTMSSLNKWIVDELASLSQLRQPVLVSLDSDHHKDHVLKEMDVYSQFVTVGSYMVVEDSFLGNMLNVKDPETDKIFYPGPHEAIDQFLETHKNWEIDKDCEKSIISQNPDGWLRKVSE